MKLTPSHVGRILSLDPSAPRGWASKGLAAAAAVLLLGALATPARAGFVTATFSNVNPGQVVTITANGQSETGWAGVYNFVNASGDLTGSFKGFCIDIGQDIFANQTVTFGVARLDAAPVPGNAMGPARADRLRELWGRDYASIGADNVKAAAFQIAVWEVINETGPALDIRAGSFSVSGVGSATLDQAQTWLSQLDGTGPRAGLIALTSDAYQDYAVQAVPAPPTFILATIGAVAFLPLARRRRKREPLTPGGQSRR